MDDIDVHEPCFMTFLIRVFTKEFYKSKLCPPPPPSNEILEKGAKQM